MNPKTTSVLKIVAAVIIGMCVVVLLGANKIASSIVLTITAVVTLLPTSKSEWLQWCRLAFMCCAMAFVLWNISTTELPPQFSQTGVKFFDQVLYIFDVFLKNIFGTR